MQLKNERGSTSESPTKNKDDLKLGLIIAEIQSMQENYPKNSSTFKWLNSATFSIDGALRAIVVDQGN